MANFSEVFIIYNPKSTGDSKKLAKQLERKLTKVLPKIGIKTIATEYAGHARELACDLSKKIKQPLIISSSGDGGYNEVVNGVMDSGNKQAVCAVLPAGNANDHGRTMHSDELWKMVLAGKVTQIDIIKVTVKSKRKKKTVRFAHSYVGLGLTPVIATELNKRKLNAFNEITLVIKTFMKYKPFEISHNGELLELNSILFANINQMAKVLTLASENRPDDGKFEVITFPASRKWELTKHLAKATLKNLETTHSLSEYSFKAIKKMPMQLDGEVMTLEADSRVVVESAHKLLKTIV